jgi:RimJ/RimL family protein N-acetyltransferase
MRNSEIETQRLVLVPLTSVDAQGLLSGVRQPNWSAGYPTEGDLEIAQMVAKAPSTFVAANRFGPYIIIDRASCLLIGGAGFIGPPGEDGAVEIGYGVAAEWRNRGIATEAVRGLLQFAWSQPEVGRVFATTDPSNAPSARVLEKAGVSFVRMQSGLKYYEITRAQDV